MTLFCEVVETKIEDPKGRLTIVIKYKVGEAKELIKQKRAENVKQKKLKNYYTKSE